MNILGFEITPCPSCETMDFVDLVYGPLIRCGTCDIEMTPEIWNAMPRRSDFHAELMTLAEGMDHMRDIKDNPIRYAAVTQMIIEINMLVKKYAPTES